MTNPDPDAELIERMAIAAYGLGIPAWRELTQYRKDIWKNQMRTILAAVRSHEAPKPSPAPKRVAVQIAASDPDSYVWAVANDGTIHLGWSISGKFKWHDQLPDLPQPDDAP